MSKHVQALTLLALFPILAGAQQNAPLHRNSQRVLAVVQTDARRPGDELLNCDRLEKELVASMNDPAVQSRFMRSGMKKQASPARGFSMSSSPDATVVSTRVRAMQLTRSLQQEVKQMNELLAIAPQLVRGQRLLQLAQARNCHWLQESESSTGHEAGH